MRDTAGELRKGQSGYVRAYAGFIGLGVVVLLAWFVVGAIVRDRLVIGAEARRLGFPILTALGAGPGVGSVLVAVTGNAGRRSSSWSGCSPPC